MVGIPAYCPSCQIGFESSSVGIPNSGNTLMIGCQVSCVLCGGAAKILDGQYSADGDRISVLAFDPRASQIVAQLNALKDRLDKKGGITKGVINALDDIDPALAKAARRLKTRKDVGYLILAGMLSVTIARLSSCAAGDSGAPLIQIDQRTQVTQVYNGPVTRIEDSAIYYPHDPKQYKDGKYTGPTTKGSRSK